MNKKTKNIILMIAALIVCIGLSVFLTIVGYQKSIGIKLFGTMTNPDEVTTYNINVSSSKLNLKVNSSFDFRFNDFFEGTTYKDRVAKFCYLEALDCINIGKVEVNGEEIAENDNYTFLSTLGFSEIYDFNLFNSYESNPNDTTRGVISMAKNSNGSKVLFLVAVEPTIETSEWMMNFDVGNSTDEYATLTGANVSEWTNKDNHKGYDVCASRVLEELYGFMESCNCFKKGTLKQVSVVFTGYSCGAAISNVASAKFIDELNSGSSKYKSMADEYRFTIDASAYTFATPKTTESENAKSSVYSSIYNHCSTEDLTPQLVPSKLGFVRYGNDIEFTMIGDEKLKSVFKTITGNEYYESDFISKLVTELNNVLTTRDDLYVVDTSSDATIHYLFYGCDSKDDADIKRDTFISSIVSDGVYQYCTVSESKQYEYQSITYWNAELNYSTGFLLGIFPTIMTTFSGGANLTQLIGYLSYFDCAKYTSLRNTIISCAFNSKSLGTVSQYHSPAAYYVLLENYWG